MPEDRINISTHRTVQSNKTALSRQVKEQTQLIGELTAMIQQKEQELAEWNGQSHLIGELTNKLQETETELAKNKELITNLSLPDKELEE